MSLLQNNNRPHLTLRHYIHQDFQNRLHIHNLRCKFRHMFRKVLWVAFRISVSMMKLLVRRYSVSQIHRQHSQSGFRLNPPPKEGEAAW